jgi:hypothetical protein
MLLARFTIVELNGNTQDPLAQSLNRFFSNHFLRHEITYGSVVVEAALDLQNASYERLLYSL